MAVLEALARNQDFQEAALPKTIKQPLYNRYDTGMEYGLHVDAPFFNSGRLRADLSFTLFLTPLDEYDGGELVIHSPFGIQEVKLPSGSVVVYPSSSLHEVAEVTRGERLVAVSWVQSYIRDDRQREILAHLAQVKDKMNDIAADAIETDLVHHTYANLLRMWAET